MADNKKIILFDGVCNLCNRIVQFIIKRDKKDQFRFASLQGETGQKILKKFGLSGNAFNSFILLEDNTIYTRSTAALRVAKKLGSGWPLLYAFTVVPLFLRNAVYNWVAGNRYKWFGKKDACWLPTPALKARFLD